MGPCHCCIRLMFDYVIYTALYNFDNKLWFDLIRSRIKPNKTQSMSVIDAAAHVQRACSLNVFRPPRKRRLYANYRRTGGSFRWLGDATWPRATPVHARLLQFSGRVLVVRDCHRLLRGVGQGDCSALDFNVELTFIVALLNGRLPVRRALIYPTPTPTDRPPPQSLKNGLNEWAWWRAGTLLALRACIGDRQGRYQVGRCCTGPLFPTRRARLNRNLHPAVPFCIN